MTTVKIPDYLQRATDDAASVGWGVVCTPKSVNFTVEGRHKPISFSLTKPPSPDQVRLQLDKAGLYGALKKLQPEAPALPEPERGVTKENKTTDKLMCPECPKGPFASGAGLGSHRQRVHGVAGTSKATVAKKAAAKKAAPAKKAPVKVVEKQTVPAQREPVESPWFTVPELAAEPVLAPNPGGITEAVDNLIAAVSQQVAPLEKKIAEQGEQIAALQGFKDAVEAEVTNGNQAPLQTLANILKHGGEGFGTPKA